MCPFYRRNRTGRCGRWPVITWWSRGSSWPVQPQVLHVVPRARGESGISLGDTREDSLVEEAIQRQTPGDAEGREMQSRGTHVYCDCPSLCTQGSPTHPSTQLQRPRGTGSCALGACTDRGQALCTSPSQGHSFPLFFGVCAGPTGWRSWGFGERSTHNEQEHVDSEPELGSEQALPRTSCVMLAVASRSVNALCLGGGNSNPTVKAVMRLE